MTVDLRKITRRSICVCHPPTPGRYRDFEPGTGREILLRDGSTEWEHADDATAAYTHHAHVERSSSDCDGGHGDDYVIRPNTEAEHANTGPDSESDIGFWLSTWHWACSPFAGEYGGKAEFSVVEDQWGNKCHRVEYSGGTDEGYEHEIRTMCYDPDCAYDQHSVYDQYAQAMNY